MNDDEEIPYRSRIPGLQIPTDKTVLSKDANEMSSLEAGYLECKSVLDELDKWSAFNTENDSDGKIKEQIRVNKRVYQIVAPLAESLKNALALVNDKYKE